MCRASPPSLLQCFELPVDCALITIKLLSFLGRIFLKRNRRSVRVTDVDTEAVLVCDW